ncbi:hypothetical protein L6452_19289 [Arctium lappa]|uniref:Uncharacterized protein n=1 Tax=Arctium lappa TaxID=4217 RepID=A0ACB9B913_ARCLA|nr:hypothetical protein L6452_19289 [Arctium lappa]
MTNEDGLEPDESTYSILITGFCRSGCLDEAGSYFYKVVKGKRKLMPNKYHYTSIIDASFKQERVEVVLRLLKDYGYSPKAYGAIIFCFLERYLSIEAVEVFKMMKDAPYGVDYKELVGWLRQYGDMNHVKMMFCYLWKTGMEDDDLRSLEEGNGRGYHRELLQNQNVRLHFPFLFH